MKLLKFIITPLSTPLAHIFSLSLKTGVFPEKLKVSRVVPIFKTGDKKICNNYRPISLVSTISKIIEKIVAIRLVNHLEINKLITDAQFGFQRRLSPEQNIIHLTNFVTEALNENKFCIGIFLDLQKAFDVVPHEILLKKLHNLGIRDTPLKWFKSYLQNRSQYVEINGKKSSKRSINISVMQGSVLGPLLFLCFINDLTNASSLLRLLLFADDTCALDKDHNLKDLILRCNIELQKIANWFLINKILLNISKCKFILFHKQEKNLTPTYAKFIIIQTLLDNKSIPKIFSNLKESQIPINKKTNIISTLESV